MRNLAPFVRRPLALTPLIDVIFLLLLFFMLTSTFSTFGEIELSNARQGSGTAQTTVDRHFVQLGPDRLTLNGQSATLDDIASDIEAGQVLVSLDQGTTAQRLVDFLHQMRTRGDLDVLVLE
ncbi:outer membrane transport energization protein ExbD [Shimia isoporae]|uniref:Outer membrane transport energization protein ExbD n=1 Tax=Shimia isoporae TaxID=647720 RepID=A0A4R1NJP4_9RHOB|nr:biopolymer transporter ExbD [Shimia isoporae]TCL08497.1 outer membrane transport energization protein ExbD [Shimia isoporae]